MSKIKLLAVAAALAGMNALQAADFFPLQEGNWWTYRIAGTDQTFTIRVEAPVTVNDRVYYTLAGYAGGLLVRYDGDKLLTPHVNGGEGIAASFEPFQAGYWDAYGRSCEAMGQTLEARGTHDGPIGPIGNVMEIRYRSFTCADTGVQSEQFAENIGMVRRTVQTIAGPRTYDLVAA